MQYAQLAWGWTLLPVYDFVRGLLINDNIPVIVTLLLAVLDTYWNQLEGTNG